MRTSEEMLRAAQSNAVIGGAVDAVALEVGGLAPQIAKAVVAWEGRQADGEAVAGLIAVGADGCPLYGVEVVRMLGAAVQVMATALGHEQDEDAEED